MVSVYTICSAVCMFVCTVQKTRVRVPGDVPLYKLHVLYKSRRQQGHQGRRRRRTELAQVVDGERSRDSSSDVPAVTGGGGGGGGATAAVRRDGTTAGRHTRPASDDRARHGATSSRQGRDWTEGERLDDRRRRHRPHLLHPHHFLLHRRNHRSSRPTLRQPCRMTGCPFSPDSRNTNYKDMLRRSFLLHFCYGCG